AANSLAALATAVRLGVPVSAAVDAIGRFQGVGRRFEVRGQVRGVTLVDDYAHNPAKVRATLQAARDRFHPGRVLACFVPHTYSRTRSLMDAYADAFAGCALLVIGPIEPARERHLAHTVSSQDLARVIRGVDDVVTVDSARSAAYKLASAARPGDVIVYMSVRGFNDVIANTAKKGRTGLEFGAGVPGMVGGSVVGNAGAFGREVKDGLISTDVIDPQGRVHTLSAAECRFAYRDSILKSRKAGWVVLSATFETGEDDPSRIRDRIKEVQRHRRQTQPIEKRSLGSTFKNPPGDAAGRLIDACGLKGRRLGDAQISEKHANFIVNLGGATADDVLALMAEMRNRVFERF